MTAERYDVVSEQLTSLAKSIASKKRPGYTQGHPDVLKNFKEGGDLARIHPLQGWVVQLHKQLAAIISFVTNPQASCGGESIDSRFADLLNYVYLGHALIRDEQDAKDNSLNREVPLGLPGSGSPYILRKIMD